MQAAVYFRVNSQKAKEIVANIKNVVGTWRNFAVMYGLPKSEIGNMEEAFIK